MTDQIYGFIVAFVIKTLSRLKTISTDGLMLAIVHAKVNNTLHTTLQTKAVSYETGLLVTFGGGGGGGVLSNIRFSENRKKI